MRVIDFERAVLEREDIVIRIRAPSKMEIGEYPYDRKAADNTTVKKWLETRITPELNGYEVEIVSGEHVTPHGRTKLSTLRESYDR